VKNLFLSITVYRAR